jgi:hypothetical protein
LFPVAGGDAEGSGVDVVGSRAVGGVGVEVEAVAGDVEGLGVVRGGADVEGVGDALEGGGRGVGPVDPAGGLATEDGVGGVVFDRASRAVKVPSITAGVAETKDEGVGRGGGVFNEVSGEKDIERLGVWGRGSRWKSPSSLKLRRKTGLIGADSQDSGGPSGMSPMTLTEHQSMALGDSSVVSKGTMEITADLMGTSPGAKKISSGLPRFGGMRPT